MGGMVSRIAIGTALVIALTAASNSPAMLGEPLTGPIVVGNKPGDPLASLPPGTRMISSFGERAVFSPDSKKVAFIGRSYGDAFEYDIATGAVRNLTAHMPHGGFLRVHYLHDGSFILTGPAALGSDRMETRFKKSELWWLDARAQGAVQRLGRFLFEGVAVSQTSNRIAWVENDPPGIDLTDEATSTLKVGEVVVRKGRARLEAVRDLLVTPRSECMLEAQDFLPDGSAVTAVCYASEFKAVVVPLSGEAATFVPMPSGMHGELEGILPDGRQSMFECGVQGKSTDICIVEFKSDHPRYSRLTHAADYGEYKFGDPQASHDGSMIAFQFAKGGDEPGTGRGILLMQLPKRF